jgi:hypothetical protein
MILSNALESIKKLVSREEESPQDAQEIKMSTTARSNPFDDIHGLVEALKAAPQDKEGAFRVATWLMVLEQMQALMEQVGHAESLAAETKSTIENQTTPTVEEIKAQVKAELQSDMNDADADVILF